MEILSIFIVYEEILFVGFRGEVCARSIWLVVLR